MVDNGNVVNEGDSIRLINGTVNLCEPLTQGRVEYDTNIVLINQNEDKYNEQESIDIENEQDLSLIKMRILICLVIYHQVYNLTNLTNIQNQKTPIDLRLVHYHKSSILMIYL